MKLRDKSFFLSQKGLSPAYFSKKKNITINNNLIHRLIKISEYKNSDLRICMHNNTNDDLQTMINILLKKKKYFYSYHLNTDEVYHIIKGKLLIIYYENKIMNKVLLSKNHNKLCLIKKKVIHVTIPLTKFCVFHETRIGPFSPKDNYNLNEVATKDYVI
jgi:cupin fold WbuC family metalloprotein